MGEGENKSFFAKNLVLNFIGLLTILPMAPLINRFIPPVIVGYWNIDLFLSILIAFVLVRIILWIFRPLMIPAFILVCGIIIYNQFAEGYNLKNMILDYKNMVTKSWDIRDVKEKDLYLVKPDLFDTGVEKAVKGLKSKMMPKDSVVRNFSVRHSIEYFDDYHSKYGPIVRYLSLFKHINSTFKYVGDPERDEYYASPKETIENGLGGDCDDHTILMISCMKAIGAKCRMVLTENHVYPELFCGDKKKFMQIQEAITHLFSTENFSGLYYREENGNYWINLDYTAHHPGGPYVDNKAYAIVEF
ncbi:MAG: transglutaminase domain-containing protein [Chitinophagaceae bacterium]|nr:transglutaminase domain-containing protein [Chitinophagaceae bacterium]